MKRNWHKDYTPDQLKLLRMRAKREKQKLDPAPEYIEYIETGPMVIRCFMSAPQKLLTLYRNYADPGQLKPWQLKRKTRALRRAQREYEELDRKLAFDETEHFFEVSRDG